VAERSRSSSPWLPDTPERERRPLRTNGVATGLSPGKIVVDMSSISPPKRRASRSGSETSDANTSTARFRAARWRAKRRPHPSMVGGPEATFGKVKAALRADGQEQKSPCSALQMGRGRRGKSPNTRFIVCHHARGPIATAFSLASKAGRRFGGEVGHALMGGFASFQDLEVHGESVNDQAHFEPGFASSFTPRIWFAAPRRMRASSR